MLLYFKSSAQFFFLQFSFSVWWSIECKYYDPSSAERVRFNEYYLSMQGFITFYSNLTAAALLKTSPINVWYFKSHIQQRLLLVSLFAFFSRWKNFVGFRGQKTMVGLKGPPAAGGQSRKKSPSSPLYLFRTTLWESDHRLETWFVDLVDFYTVNGSQPFKILLKKNSKNKRLFSMLASALLS